ncbi:MAG: 1-acyl-sn-glycerol-3-phosphate acyltransferase [Clostridiales bacterium]|nr:1-acyl-sn-glycerol-3-phosphate acyltransferase [Clostridiales bacterium]
MINIFGNNDGTPGSPFYKFVFALVRLVFGNRPVPEYELNDFDKVEAPYVLLSNHESFNDFYYLYRLTHKNKPIYVINRFYCTRPFLHFLSLRIGMIPKKIFFDDMVTPLRIMRMIKKGYPVIIYPEGRLCIDGRTNRIEDPGGAFYKKLGVDIVLVNVKGAFCEKPKWRKKRYRTPVKITVKKVLKKDQIASMSPEELDSVIRSTISNDAPYDPLCRYPQKDKAEGLHNILYRCYTCNGLYTTSSSGNTITCSSCGKTFTLGEDYRFTEEPYTIAAWYDRMTKIELESIKDIDLEADVIAVIHSNNGKKRKEEAHCRLTYNEFSYKSQRTSFTYSTNKLQAMLFTAGKMFETYHDDEQYYLHPVENPIQCARWAHVVDIIKSLDG